MWNYLGCIVLLLNRSVTCRIQFEEGEERYCCNNNDDAEDGTEKGARSRRAARRERTMEKLLHICADRTPAKSRIEEIDSDSELYEALTGQLLELDDATLWQQT